MSVSLLFFTRIQTASIMRDYGKIVLTDLRRTGHYNIRHRVKHHARRSSNRYDNKGPVYDIIIIHRADVIFFFFGGICLDLETKISARVPVHL